MPTNVQAELDALRRALEQLDELERGAALQHLDAVARWVALHDERKAREAELAVEAERARALEAERLAAAEAMADR